MRVLLCIDRSLRVRRYVQRDIGGGVVRLDMTDEVVIEQPKDPMLVQHLNDLREKRRVREIDESAVVA